mgnify:CR=1 FL=1
MKQLFTSIALLIYSVSYSQIDSLDIKNYYYRYMNNGFKAYQNNNVVDALYFYETAHKTLPKDTAALLNIMHIHLDQKNFSSAANIAEKLIGINYYPASVYSLLASIKLNENKVNEALLWVNKGLQKHNGNKMLLLMKSNLELDNNQEKDAIATIKKIISVTNEKHYYCNIGQLYENIEEVDSAIAAYKSCLAFIPDNLDALHGLAFLYFAEGEKLYDEARNLPLEENEKYKLNIQNAKTFFQQANIYASKAVDIAPENSEIKSLSLQIERRLIAP